MTLVYVNNDDDALSPVRGIRRPLTAAPDWRPGAAGGPGGVVPPAPEDCLPRREIAAEERAAVWWLGAHGGAGESTLEELFAGSRAAGHAWPLAPSGEPPARVVLVARTHAHGLKAAQLAIRDWAVGGVPVLLLGLVLIADAPGRLPHALRQLAGLIAGGAPAVWSLPWIEAWRVGDPPGPSNAPKVVRRLLEDLRAMTEAPASVNANRNEEE
jgi:uncharacterized protein DUF6668